MDDLILGTEPLGFPWKTQDPFLFCVHHDDHYPAGNDALGPDASLDGRALGSDFTVKDGWRMYHGQVVPGFPRHPHRGFETITLARRGLIDHSDSLGATARFGHGDVQWMTAGRGIVHAEMFPLLDRERPNPTELFQIWLNLPQASKMVAPHFTMMWNETIPRVSIQDDRGRSSSITVIAGRLHSRKGPPPPPDSWAANRRSEIAIWTITLAPGARLTLPPASEGVNRTLYLFRGDAIRVAGTTLPCSLAVKVRGDRPAELKNGTEASEILMLQGRPIGEPVAHQGPFVMNTREEVRQAFLDYRATGFGGWPWPNAGPVHPRDRGRFALHADGREDRPKNA